MTPQPLYIEPSCTFPYRGWVLALTAVVWTVSVYGYGLLLGYLLWGW